MYYRYYLSIFVVMCQLHGQVIFTEIMYDLPGTDSPNEFVECFNTSSDTISLNNWRLKDKYTSDFLVDTNWNFIVSPQSYFLIMEGDYIAGSGIYQSLIPEYTPMFYVDDASIGNGLSASDSLFIIDSSGTVIDSIGWDDIANDGYSIERIRLDQPSTPANWITSLDSLGSPGFVNSVFPHQTDGRIVADLSHVMNDSILISDSLYIQIAITNVGLETLNGILEISWNDQILNSIHIEELTPLDTVSKTINAGVFSSGYQSLLCLFSCAEDGNPDDNSILLTFGVRYLNQMVQLNEFLPIPSENQYEFIEYINTTSDTIFLVDWSISDANTTRYYFPPATLSPNQYIVIGNSDAINVPDSSLLITPIAGFPTLNNSGDKIRLFDPFGTLIDSLTYTSAWGIESGKSLEKIFPTDAAWISSNWKTNILPMGQTPGFRNSVMPWRFDLGVDFPPLATIPDRVIANQPFTLTTPVINHGTEAIQLDQISCEIFSENVYFNFDVIIQVTDTVVFQLPLQPLPGGNWPIKIHLVSEVDQFPLNDTIFDTLRISFPSKSVVINEFMPRPNNDQTEFVEFVAMDTVNLHGWAIWDSRSRGSTLSHIALVPNTYYTVAADSHILSILPNNSGCFIDHNMPSLNNAGDAIKIVDHTGHTIDSLIYDSEWDIRSELSLEKFYPNLESSNPNHWQPSTESIGMTPGYINSVTLLDYNGVLNPVGSHTPFYPSVTDSILLSVTCTNAGRMPISGEVTIEIKDEEIGAVSIPTLAWRDTTTIIIHLPTLPSGEHFISAYFFVIGEEYPFDNLALDTIGVSYPFGAAMFNELLIDPAENQAEFVEIVNQENVHFSRWGISKSNSSIRILPEIEFDDLHYLVVLGDSLFALHIPSAGWVIPQNGFPGLSNSGGALYLHDHTGAIIDSLIYSTNWKIVTGRSLEKYRPEFHSSDSTRWGLNTNSYGASPGEQNSIYYEKLSRSNRLTITPNPFSPDNDGYEDVLTIHFSSPFESPIARIQLFDILGRKVKTLAWDQPVLPEDILTWDGFDDNYHTCKIGIYILKFELVDQISNKNWEEIKTVVLAKPL